MTIEQYVQRINTGYKTCISRENSYRGDLQNMPGALCDDTIAEIAGVKPKDLLNEKK